MDSGTKLIGLFGHPVGHSLSPSFMNEALRALGVNCVYLAFDVEEGLLGEAVRSLRPLGWKGANVTIPHKQAVTGFLDLVDDDARTIGAVNCIVNRDGSLLGYNTDHLGFRAALEKRGFHLGSITAALIGCGGAARGVLFALVKGGVGKVYLINRTESRALELAAWAGSRLGFGGIEYIGDGRAAAREGAFKKAFAEASLVVNTTPVGMRWTGGSTPLGTPSLGVSPLGESPLGSEVVFRPGVLVYDLVYNPRKTELLKMAEKRGASTMNGLPMLILQGLHALSLWFPEKGSAVFSLEKRLLGRSARAGKRAERRAAVPARGDP